MERMFIQVYEIPTEQATDGVQVDGIVKSVNEKEQPISQILPTLPDLTPYRATEEQEQMRQSSDLPLSEMFHPGEEGKMPLVEVPSEDDDVPLLDLSESKTDQNQQESNWQTDVNDDIPRESTTVDHDVLETCENLCRS